jgi:hypothetical protein
MISSNSQQLERKMATTDQLLKASRKAASGLPCLNDFSRDNWVDIVRAMDTARFGELQTLVNRRWTKMDLYNHVVKRIVAGEPFPTPTWRQ